MNNSIVHMDLDSFFVSVERLQNKKLLNKPVLIGGASGRSVVASCSYEARKFGVHSAMPMRTARELCPEAIVVSGHHSDYTKHSRIVTEIIQEAVPLFEKTSIDEFYIDLTGMDKFYGCLKMASELRQRIMKESGLPISFGLSANKTVSKVATGEAKPNNQLHIDFGREKPFLAPLSVRKIPMVGEKTYRSLCSMGIKKIHALQDIPVELMEKVFGQAGIQIWKKANGIDHSRVEPYSERKSISTERTFDTDTTDVKMLNAILISMVEQLTFQLRAEQKLTSCVAVKIRYSDFQTQTMQCRLSYTAADHVLIPRVQELFKKLYNRRVLIRLIGIRFSDLVHGGLQMNLFDGSETMSGLYQAMDVIRDKYGKLAVYRAGGHAYRASVEED